MRRARLMKENAKRDGPEAQPVRIEFYDARAQAVAIAGTFNHWQPRSTAMVPLGRGRWLRVLFLSPRHHQFNFVVDGRGLGDPAATVDTKQRAGACELVIQGGGRGQIPGPPESEGKRNQGQARRAPSAVVRPTRRRNRTTP